MSFQPHTHRTKNRRMISVCALLVLLVSALGPRPVLAQTYVSAEPIPSPAVVGDANLAKIESLGYSNLELWSQRLLNDCHVVQNVIESLSAHGAITTVTPWNTRYLVAAGGFQAVTDPSYVFTMKDSGPGAVSAADVTESGRGALANRRITFPLASRNSSRAVSEARAELLSQ